jgi:hypothetical protein
VYCESVLDWLESGGDFILAADYSNISVIHSHIELQFAKAASTFVVL